MFDKGTIIIPDGTYYRREQKIEVNKIIAPNGEKLSLGVLKPSGPEFVLDERKPWTLTFVIYSNNKEIVKIPTKVANLQRGYEGIIYPPTIDAEVLSDYISQVVAQGCGIISGVLPIASGYQSSWLGNVAESGAGKPRTAMENSGFKVIVPNEHYRKDFLLMARDLPAVNNPELESIIAKNFVEYVHNGKQDTYTTLNSIREYFEPHINQRKTPGKLHSMDTSAIPNLI